MTTTPNSESALKSNLLKTITLMVVLCLALLLSCSLNDELAFDLLSTKTRHCARCERATAMARNAQYARRLEPPIHTLLIARFFATFKQQQQQQQQTNKQTNKQTKHTPHRLLRLDSTCRSCGIARRAHVSRYAVEIRNSAEHVVSCLTNVLY